MTNYCTTPGKSSEINELHIAVAQVMAQELAADPRKAGRAIRGKKT